MLAQKITKLKTIQHLTLALNGKNINIFNPCQIIQFGDDVIYYIFPFLYLCGMG